MSSRWAVALIALVALLVPAACSGDDGDDTATPADDATPTTEAPTAAIPTGPTAAELCADAAAGVTTAVETPSLTEISGLAASRTSAPVIWAHNDSGGTPQVWALWGDGQGDRPYTVEGAAALDWEDMASGPGPDGDPYLYIGDIGDNGASRESVSVYVAPEPVVDPDGSGGTITDVETVTLQYEDGPVDAEVLLADPRTGDLFVVAKSLLGGPVGLYRIPADALVDPDPTVPVVMERVGDVPLDLGQAATGGDVAPDGSVIAIRTYDDVLLWDRGPDESMAEALTGEPCAAPSVEEQQGEAIAFAADGRGYLTISEGANPPVNWFRLPE